MAVGCFYHGLSSYHEISESRSGPQLFKRPPILKVYPALLMTRTAIRDIVWYKVKTLQSKYCHTLRHVQQFHLYLVGVMLCEVLTLSLPRGSKHLRQAQAKFKWMANQVHAFLRALSRLDIILKMPSYSIIFNMMFALCRCYMAPYRGSSQCPARFGAHNPRFQRPPSPVIAKARPLSSLACWRLA